ncbi:NAD(P)-binding protein [Thozetella sp. PMI_491]|nr:NAD(P)-binding protein [Thozetella sp. PMI_491]
MTSDRKFDIDTQGTEVAAKFASRIQGKTSIYRHSGTTPPTLQALTHSSVLVTGVSPGGIGESTALAFASQQPDLLILASRTKANIDAVAESIKEKHPDVKVKIVVVDFASQKSIRSAAEEVLKEVPKIDIFVNNAAISPFAWQWTEERLEIQLGANHIGPFLFTNLLLPLVRNAAKDAAPGDTRIVNVASAGHHLSPIRFHDYNFEGKEIPDEEKPPSRFMNAGELDKTTRDGYPRFTAYGQCKTANILFTLSLQQHLQAEGIVSYSLHPGTITTHLGRDQGQLKPSQKPFPPPEWKTKTLDGGSSTTLVAALDPALNEIHGLYLNDCNFEEPAAHAKDPVVAEKLWHLSEELVGQKFAL